MTVWETLGLEPTNEQAAIKRAYAAKLKLVRPDEDPVGFQALREARDEALYLSAYLNDQGEWEDDDWDEDAWDDDPRADELPPDEPRADELRADAPRADDASDADNEASDDHSFDEESAAKQSPDQTEAPAPYDKTAPLILADAAPAPRAENPAPKIMEQPAPDREEELPPEAKASTSEPATSPAGATVLIDLRQSADQAEPTPQDHSTAPPPEEPEPADEAELTYEQIDEKLEQLTGPWGGWQMEAWQPFIDDIREQSFDITDYAERRILYAVSDHLSEKPAASEDEIAHQRAIISLLDDAFGWHQNDRRVHNLLGNEAADKLMNRIRWRETTEAVPKRREFFDAVGFPAFTSQDFKDYLGKSETVYETYYQRCLEAGHKYIHSWSWPGFFFSPLWLAHRCNDGIEALTGIGYTLGIVLLIFGINNSGSILGYAGLLILLSLHLLIGFYGKRILIGTMATAFTELEMDSKVSKKKRQEKLKKLGQGGSKAIFETIIGNLGIGIIILTVLAFFTGG